VTYVFEAGGPEQGVGDGVGEDIGVGVAEEAPLEWYLDATKYDLKRRASRDADSCSSVVRERVRVDA
jgi:cytidylate kinase